MALQTPAVINAGVNANKPLGGTATFALVDNNTDNSAYFPAARRYVYARETNALLQLTPTQQGEVVWQTPPQTTEPPYNGQQQLSVQWLDADTAAAFVGTSPISAFTQPTRPLALLATFTSGAGINVVTNNIPLPTGCQAVRIVWRQLTGGFQPIAVKVTDSSGSITWASCTPGNNANITMTDLIAPVVPSVDNNIQVQFAEAAANTHRVYILAVFEASYQAVLLVGASGSLPVGLSQVSGNNVATAPSGVLPVTDQSAGTPFYQASAVGAAQTVTLTTPNPNVTKVRLSSVVVSWSGATAGAPALIFSDSSGAGTIWESTVGVSIPTAAPPFIFPVPFAAATGNGGLVLTVTAVAGIASLVSGIYMVY